ncbi:hypothetical protein KUD11_02270 [Roseovarius sp. LXJ103]|nr:hypothetical protein [Roseovarius carneus]MBZ8117465.1 hypothetical protein [Roseovarius carneus]
MRENAGMRGLWAARVRGTFPVVFRLGRYVSRAFRLDLVPQMKGETL